MHPKRAFKFDLNYSMEFVNQNISTHLVARTPSELPIDNTFSLAGNPRKYSRQFFSMYQHRLSLLKPRVDAEAMEKWGHNTRRVDGKVIQHREKILDITLGQLCWVLGTIFADMRHKLNILQDVEKGTDDVMPRAPKTYVDGDNPVIMIEDESGRAILHNEGLLKNTGLVTGCFVAVLGIEIQAGIFEIMEVVYPSAAPQKTLTPSNAPRKCIALVSGLNFCKDTQSDLRLVLLQQWLSGELGGSDDSEETAQICRLVIAGNSVAEIPPDSQNATTTFGSKNTLHFSADSLVLFNKWLAEVISTIPVSIMPGDTDPAEICLPQQPMHRSLFGTNSRYIGEAVQTLTNPTWMDMDGLRVLGTSGQNIDDILKYYSHPVEAVDVMARTIKWQNIAPTAPDTLYCYPYDDLDPFTLTETPHVFFAGNQALAGFQDYCIGEAKVKLVSVPKFSETGEVILLDLETSEVTVVKIEI